MAAGRAGGGKFAPGIAVGGDLSHVVQLCRFIVDMEKHQDAINRCWPVTLHRPTSTTVGRNGNGPTPGARINRRGGGAGVTQDSARPATASHSGGADIESRMNR